MHRRLVIVMTCAVLFSVSLAIPGVCEDSERNLDVGGDFAWAVSQSAYPFWGLSAGYHLLSSDDYKVETGRRVVDAILIAGGATQLLKGCINSRRPYPHEANLHGMPSGHATVSFAVAAALSERDPHFKIPAYATASWIGWSRHQVKAHHWNQILLGAVLGTYLGGRAGRGELTLWGHEDGSSLSFSPVAGPITSTSAGEAFSLVYQTSF